MIYWIWLTQIPFIGPVTTRYLIKELGDAEKIYQADYETLSEMSGLSARQRESTSGIIHWKKRRGSWMIVKTKISLSYAGMMSVIPCVPENLLMHHQCYQENGSDSWNSRCKKMQPESKTGNGISGIRICKDPDCSCQWNGQRNRQLCTYCMSQRRWLYNSNIRKWSGYLLSK